MYKNGIKELYCMETRLFLAFLLFYLRSDMFLLPCFYSMLRVLVVGRVNFQVARTRVIRALGQEPTL
jgi:hypothetical protein